MPRRCIVLSGLAVTAGFADGVVAGLTGSPVAIAAIGAFVIALAFCIAKMTAAFGEWQHAKGAVDAHDELRRNPVLAKRRDEDNFARPVNRSQVEPLWRIRHRVSAPGEDA